MIKNMKRMEWPDSLKQVLNKMCQVVNVDFDTFDFNQPDWYLKHTWNEKQCQAFKDWFVHELQTNTKFRKELFRYRSTNKVALQRAVDQFIFNYGWKDAQEEKI